MKVWGMAILLGGTGAVAACGAAPADPEAEAKARAEAEAAAVAVTAGQLFDEFQANEVAAKGKYGESPIRISGRIADITLDFMDEPVVSLETSNQFMSVQVGFDKEDAAATGALQKGAEFTAVCAELSEVAGTPMLDECHIVG